MSEFRTSVTHPLRVDIVDVPGAGGRIGMTLCPGRSDDLSFNGIRWRRDLDADLEVIRRLEPCLLITLNESHEFKALGVPDFKTVLASSGLPWRHLPIRDAGVPGPAFKKAWRTVGREARECLCTGRLVVIHCRAGLGRTGMIAAKLVVKLGMHSDAAVTAVRKARPKTIETPAQMRHVEETLQAHD